MKTRYFYCLKDESERVIVFPDGAEPGMTYWSDGDQGVAWWRLTDMKRARAKEITRTKALRMVKNLPK